MITHAGTPRDEEGHLMGPLVEARIKGEAGTCTPEEVDFIDVAPHEFVSVATSLIPFLQNDDANRALMGSNMQRQAVVSVKPDAPYVSTGQEEKVALGIRDTSSLRKMMARSLAVDASHIVA